MIKLGQPINVPVEVSETTLIVLQGEYQGNQINPHSNPCKFNVNDDKNYIAQSYDPKEKKCFGSYFHVKQSEVELWLSLG